MGIRESNEKWMRFLDYYGMGRASGVTIRNAVIGASDSPTNEALDEFNAKVDLFRAMQRVKQGLSPGDYVRLTGAFAAMVPSIVGIFSDSIGRTASASGAILGEVYAMIGRVADFAMGYRCPTCEADCHYPISYHRRDMIGLNTAPGTVHVCGGGLYMHLNDGIVVHGLGGGLDGLGRQAGARAWTTQCGGRLGGNESNRAWAASKGESMTPEQYAARAQEVRRYVKWIEDHAPCAALRCMESILQGIGGMVEQLKSRATTSAENTQADMLAAYWARLPSRWYASIWYLANDAVDLGVVASLDQAFRRDCMQLLRDCRARALTLPSTWTPYGAAGDLVRSVSALPAQARGGQAVSVLVHGFSCRAQEGLVASNVAAADRAKYVPVQARGKLWGAVCSPIPRVVSSVRALGGLTVRCRTGGQFGAISDEEAATLRSVSFRDDLRRAIEREIGMSTGTAVAIAAGVVVVGGLAAVALKKRYEK